MRLHLICCEIFYRETCLLVAGSPHTIDVEFLPKGLHDLGSDKMLARLQERVDGAAAGYDAVLMGYGLCNNGICGLRAGATQLVIPRAHDCISLFMGSRARYQDYFNSHPGTYYRTTGWYEREDPAGTGEITVQERLGLFRNYDELVALYGEENAQYIRETMGDGLANYDRITFIAMGLEAEEPFRRRAVTEASERGWNYDELKGDLSLLRKLLNGDWDENFLIVPPGRAVKATHDDGIIAAI